MSPSGLRPTAPAPGRDQRTARGLAAALALGATASLATGAIPAGAASEPSGTINLVAYSTPAPAYEALIRAFNKTKAGAKVAVLQSYGASGSQAKAVIAGQPADLVNFSTATDMESLVEKNLVGAGWDANTTTHGMVTDSVVVFVVPKGNPEHVSTWADLLKPDVRVFTPNPFSSGSARWNVMAAYGAQLKLHRTAAEAQSYVKDLLAKAVVQGTSANVELQDFLSDEAGHPADVLLDYEDDAIQAERAHQPISYVIPKQTILIENPLAITTDTTNRSAAQAFYSYLFSTGGQEEWAKLGYRPTLPAVAAKTRALFPHPADLFTIESLGGWDQVAQTFFGTSTSSPGIITEIEKNLGQTT